MTIIERLILVFVLIYSISLGSCMCDDCPPDIIAFQMFFDDSDTAKHYHNSMMEGMKDALLIKTTNGDLNDPIDTTKPFHRATQPNHFHFRIHSFDFEYDYILQNDSPYFRHEIFGLKLKTEDQDGFCACDKVVSQRVVLDSTIVKKSRNTFVSIFRKD
jgi:hypothetical protein